VAQMFSVTQRCGCGQFLGEEGGLTPELTGLASQRVTL